MKIEFDVNMTTAKMYDYVLKHSLTSFTGIMSEAVGFFLVIAFAISMKWAYLVVGIVIIFYLPVELYFKAKHQVSSNEVFSKPLHYVLDDEGVTITVGENSDSMKWTDMYRATSTFRSIILYTNRVNACLFPKEDLGDKKDKVIEIISTHMKPQRVNIKC